MFYNYCLDVPDASGVRLHVLPLARVTRRHGIVAEVGAYLKIAGRIDTNQRERRHV